ncbi:MAG TPA: HD domain-containing protein [Actinobacteria bacterium]|nr:HD domain-containing protein [Actinomycetota bacterium]
MMDREELRSRLVKKLSSESLKHSERTAETAAWLAKAHDANIEKAELAGLAHDVARDLTGEELLRQAERYGLGIGAIELARPCLLHAAVGAIILGQDYGIQDQEILEAVRNHTFGRTKMNKLDKIVYLADVVEPRRDYAGIDELRKLAKTDLNKAFAKAYQLQILRTIKGRRMIHPDSFDVWNSVVKEVE